LPSKIFDSTDVTARVKLRVDEEPLRQQRFWSAHISSPKHDACVEVFGTVGRMIDDGDLAGHGQVSKKIEHAIADCAGSGSFSSSPSRTVRARRNHGIAVSGSSSGSGPIVSSSDSRAPVSRSVLLRAAVSRCLRSLRSCAPDGFFFTLAPN
jgi:hypothetical protein